MALFVTTCGLSHYLSSPRAVLLARSHPTRKEGVHWDCPDILLGWMGSVETLGHKGQAGGSQGTGNPVCSWHSWFVA